MTEVIYDAGYQAPSRLRRRKATVATTPSAWRDGGRGETIRYVVTDSPLGPLLVAATPKGICRLTFDEDESALRRRFPNADIRPDDGTIAPWVEGALAAIDHPQAAPELPIDVHGTAFQEAVWQELRKIPLGETRSDADIAQVRLAIRTPLALSVPPPASTIPSPCSSLAHRVIRWTEHWADMLGRVDRKKKLLAAEGAMISQPYVIYSRGLLGLQSLSRLSAVPFAAVPPHDAATCGGSP